MKVTFAILCTVVAVVTAYSNSDIISARIETCRGCSLNRLPQVKSFVMEDAPAYARVRVEFITGAPPELVLLDAAERELERLPLSQLSRHECNQLLQDKGFSKKENEPKSEF